MIRRMTTSSRSLVLFIVPLTTSRRQLRHRIQLTPPLFIINSEHTEWTKMLLTGSLHSIGVHLNYQNALFGSWAYVKHKKIRRNYCGKKTWKTVKICSRHINSLPVLNMCIQKGVFALNVLELDWIKLNWPATTWPGYTTRVLIMRVSVTIWLAVAKLGRLVLGEFWTHDISVRLLSLELSPVYFVSCCMRGNFQFTLLLLFVR